MSVNTQSRSFVYPAAFTSARLASSPLSARRIWIVKSFCIIFPPFFAYAGKGDIPAWEMIRHSVNIHRGCFGGCSFCTISAHQGKFINSRSERSILAEVEHVVKSPGFKGYLSDVGAPSANMYRMGGRDFEFRIIKCEEERALAAPVPPRFSTHIIGAYNCA